MSWLFSRALVEEYSAASCSDGEPSAQLSANHTPQAYLSPDKTTDFSRLSRFGMTFAPLTESLGAELLTWFLAGFPVRTSAQPERAPESTGNAVDCGAKWQGSFAKYDQATSLWKTAQCSLLEDSDEFSETWPRWGLMRDGECWERITSVPLISANESGLLLTPLKIDANLSASLRDGYSRDHSFGSLSEQLITLHNLRPTAVFVEKLMGWPTMWTGLQRLGTDKFQEWQQQHG